MKSFLLRVTRFLLLILPVFAWSNAASQTDPLSHKGVLDLSSRDLAEEKIIELNGQWEFYWQQLLTPADFQSHSPPEKTGYLPMPSFWKDHEFSGQPFTASGFATYRLLVKIKPSQVPTSLTVSGVISAYRLWVNGQLLGEDGIVSRHAAEEISGKNSITLIPLATCPPQKNTHELILQVSNHRHWSGGAYLPLRLGLEQEIAAQWDRERLFLVFCTSILLLMGCYHLVLYLFRRQDPSPLYFGIYCLLWLGQFMASGGQRWMLYYLFPSIDPTTVYYIDSIAYLFSIPFALLFFCSLFPDEGPHYLPKIHLVLASVLSLYLVFHEQIRLEGFLIAHLVSVAAIISCIVILVKAALYNRQSSIPILVGCVILALCGLNDILHSIRIIHTGSIMPAGFLLFISCQTWALALRFSTAYHLAETLSSELQQKNITLARMDKLKDEFLANTSHELRTPLSGIIGLAESMQAGASGKLSASAKHNLAMVVASGRRLAGLVNDLLDFSRLTNKGLVLNSRAVDIQALAELVLTIMAPLAEAKGVRLILAVPDRLPPVSADEDRLQQIFYNLVGNAIKFTEQGRVTVSATAVNQNVEVRINDTGIGIPPDKLEDIFLSFEQVDAAATRKFGGTGLGLSISKQLVELHGGVIRVESKLNRGSTFFFTLPVANTTTTAAEPLLNEIVAEFRLQEEHGPVTNILLQDPDHKQHKSGHTILVVDDDPVNLQVAANHLITEGHRVQVATNGSQALESMPANSMPDLVLLDVMMPGITGYEVCRKLRKDHSTSSLPIIMLTARNRVSDLVRGFDNGANDYLTKPFSREELLSRVKIQLQLTAAYRVLSENIRLKKELGLRRETERHLLLVQRRLSTLLDTVDEAIIAVNEDEEITFCNKACQELLGYAPKTLLGSQVWSICRTEAVSSLQPLIRKSLSSGAATTLQDVRLHRADRTHLAGSIVLTTMELEEELLSVLLIRQAAPPDGSDASAASPGPSLALLAELNRNQQRLRTLEETLSATLTTKESTTATVRQEISAIDTALATMSQALLFPEKEADRNQLIVLVMNLSIDYWVETTGLEKSDLARESNLWKVYTNKDGWARTQTLDKYLDGTTLPKWPRWKLVLSTGDFVLTFADTPSPLRTQLESALSRLRLAC